MNTRSVPAAVSAALCSLATAGCATVDEPAYPVVVDRRIGPEVREDGRLAGAPLALAAAPVEVGAAVPDAPDPTGATATRPESIGAVASAAPSAPAVAGSAGLAPPAIDAGVDARVHTGIDGGTDTGAGAAVGILESGRTVTLYVSDDAFRAEYETDVERFNLDETRLAGGFLLSEERDNVFTGTLMLDTFPGLVPDVRLSFGARGYVALLGLENRDVFGIGLGVQGAYELPVERLPLQLGSELFYTPDALAFGQSDRIIDWNVDVGLAVRDNVSAFVGFRFLEFDTRPGDREVEDDIHVGLRWAFADGDSAEVAAAPPPPRFR